MTDTFISYGQGVVVRMEEVTAAKVESRKVGDYGQGSGLFILLGVIFAFIIPPLTLVMLLLALGARLTSIYEYSLVITSKGYDKAITTGPKGDIQKLSGAINRNLLQIR